MKVRDNLTSAIRVARIAVEERLAPGLAVLATVFRAILHPSSFILGCALTGFVGAQQYPAKPVRLVMPFPAGGPTDILGRLIGQRLTEAWGQNVMIDNRPGGAGMIGAVAAVKSPPDGYTLFLGGVTTLAIAPFVQKDMPYDPLRDFIPVTQTTIQPIMLMAHPSLPVRTVKEYVALARARPGQINIATSGQGC